MKSTARKIAGRGRREDCRRVRRLGGRRHHPVRKVRVAVEGIRGNLTRAAVELAKDWRTDRAPRRLEALLAGRRPHQDPAVVGDRRRDPARRRRGGGRLRGAHALAAARALLEAQQLRRRARSPSAPTIPATFAFTNGSSFKEAAKPAPRRRHISGDGGAEAPARNPTAGDRRRAGSVHRRPEGRQARRRGGAAQPLAPPAGRAPRCANPCAEEHHAHRPRGRQDRDRAAGAVIWPARRS